MDLKLNLTSFETMLLERVARLTHTREGPTPIVCIIDAGTEENIAGYEGYRWDRTGTSSCRDWEFAEGDDFVSIALHEFTAHRPGPWSPDSVPEVLPVHNHWYVMFEATGAWARASHYFLYPTIVDDVVIPRLARWIMRELTTIQNWRVVRVPGEPLTFKIALMGLRRAVPLWIFLTAAAAIVLLVWLIVSSVRRRLAKKAA